MLSPGAMEIMTTSIQVLENRLKRNRMAGTRRMFYYNLIVPKSVRLIFTVQRKRLPPDRRQLRRKWMNYYR